MCMLMEERGQANQKPLLSLSFQRLGKSYDSEIIGYKIMLPDSNINVKIGYCITMNNAGKTLFI